MQESFREYPSEPGKRRACEIGCHEFGDIVAEVCREHQTTQAQKICLAKVMQEVDKCIRQYA